MEVQLAGAAVPFACTLIAHAMPIMLGLGKIFPTPSAIECDLHIKMRFSTYHSLCSLASETACNVQHIHRRKYSQGHDTKLLDTSSARGKPLSE